MNQTTKDAVNQFRKKPVVIEAVQISKRMDLTSPEWWAAAVQSNAVIVHGMGKFTRDQPWVEIQTLEGTMRGDAGDWIIRGVQGELYPCKPDIFDATYEPAHIAPTPAVAQAPLYQIQFKTAAASSLWFDVRPEEWERKDPNDYDKRIVYAAPAAPTPAVQAEEVQWEAHLAEVVEHTIDTLTRQLELIAERAPGSFLDKVPVVRSLTAHRQRLERALTERNASFAATAPSTGEQV
jgi:hypothetical protein